MISHLADSTRFPVAADTGREVKGRMLKRPFAVACAALLALVAGCGDDSGSRSSADPLWSPSVTLSSVDKPNSRGLLDRRGLIHAHSYFSHDACDNEPVKNGVRDEVCFDDFRRGLCQSKHDYVMLTDHPAEFHLAEFPDSVLYRPDRGDQLVVRNGRPVASWAGCNDGHSSLILAGSESSAVMPVGLEQHVADGQSERDAVYGSRSSEAADVMRDNGAVILVAHTEGHSVRDLIDRNLDGFEMYNIHANLLRPQAIGKAVQLLFRLGLPGADELAHPDLALLYLITEDPAYLTRWGSVLAAGARRVTTMGTDCHRNTFPVPMQDGERVDSYRRMMMWFSNHLLVAPERNGSWDDRHLKEALAAGRLYGAFELLGYPSGFDFHASTSSTTVEMGGALALADRPTLLVTMPSVRGLDPAAAPPVLQARILRAIDGGFEEVSTGSGNLTFQPSAAGAYRAEIRILPNHLRSFMGKDADELLSHDYVWVYSNAIYIDE